MHLVETSFGMMGGTFQRSEAKVDSNRAGRPAWLLALCLLQIASWVFPSPSAAGATDAEWVRLDQARRVLLKTDSGRGLLESASLRFQVSLTEKEMPRGESALITPALVSRTDSVLNRGIDPVSGRESRSFQTRVSLKASQPLEDLVLDFAHELTHAIRNQPVDPYDPSMNVEKYVVNAITGPGGEVDAVEQECRVGLELASRFGLSMERCKRYQSKQSSVPGSVDRAQILRDFGASGRYRRAIQERLGAEVLSRIGWITDREPEFFSSTGAAPYPAALIEEYDQLNEAACENSRKRVQLLSASAPERTPANTSGAALDSARAEARWQALQEARRFLNLRCR